MLSTSKNRILLLAFVSTSVILFGCSKTPATEESSGDSTAVASQDQDTAAPATSTFVLWYELGVRDAAGEKAKYLTTVYLGEQLQRTGDTASEKSGNKLNHYYKVTLSDGKSGWVRGDFIAVDLFPAAIIASDAAIHKRPDASTVTNQSLPWKTFISARKLNEEWYEVKGKRSGDKWFTTGFVKASTITMKPIEVQYAALSQRVEDSKADIANVLASQLDDQSVFGESEFFQSEHKQIEMENNGGMEESGDVADMGGIISDDMVLLYFFDNTTSDEAGENHGINEGGTFVPDQYGNENSALHCNGESFVVVDADLKSDVQPPFSVSAFFKTDEPNRAMQTIVSRGRSSDGTGFNFGYTFLDGQPAVFFGFVATAPIGVMAIAPEAAYGWHHLAGTFDGRNIKLFLDGRLVGMQSVPAGELAIIQHNLSQTEQNIEIGRELASLGRYFSGDLDAVVIYNTALSDERAIGLKDGF